MQSGIHSVSTMTPLRVSLMGGGSDFPEHYSRHGGAVVSMAIQQFTYVTVKRHSELFGERYRVSYSETEHCDRRDDIRNDICRAALELLGIDEPLHISTSSDLPAQSGLGSSSSFAVGLLLALHTMHGRRVPSAQLAREACQVELEILRRPMGIQDQFAAALGGMNALYIERDGTVKVESIGPSPGRDAILNSLKMVWTGRQRKAESVLAEQQANTHAREREICELQQMAGELRSLIARSDFPVEEFGNLLTTSWEVKRSLAGGVSDESIDALVQRLLNAGVLGAKVLGAGGGGFVLIACHQPLAPALLSVLDGETVLPVRVENHGARVMSTVVI